MSRVVLITQLQQTLQQLWDLEVQTALSDIPTQQLLETLKERLAANPATAEEQAALTAFFRTVGYVLGEQSLPADIPEHVTISWIIDKLEIARSTFYKSVCNILLFPVLFVGSRPYFLKADVIALFEKTNGKGPHILGKLAKIEQSKS